MKNWQIWNYFFFKAQQQKLNFLNETFTEAGHSPTAISKIWALSKLCGVPFCFFSLSSSRKITLLSWRTKIRALSFWSSFTSTLCALLPFLSLLCLSRHQHLVAWTSRTNKSNMSSMYSEKRKGLPSHSYSTPCQNQLRHTFAMLDLNEISNQTILLRWLPLACWGYRAPIYHCRTKILDMFYRSPIRPLWGAEQQRAVIDSAIHLNFSLELGNFPFHESNKLKKSSKAPWSKLKFRMPFILCQSKKKIPISSTWFFIFISAPVFYHERSISKISKYGIVSRNSS